MSGTKEKDAFVRCSRRGFPRPRSQCRVAGYNTQIPALATDALPAASIRINGMTTYSETTHCRRAPIETGGPVRTVSRLAAPPLGASSPILSLGHYLPSLHHCSISFRAGSERQTGPTTLPRAACFRPRTGLPQGKPSFGKNPPMAHFCSQPIKHAPSYLSLLTAVLVPAAQRSSTFPSTAPAPAPEQLGSPAARGGA